MRSVGMSCPTRPTGIMVMETSRRRCAMDGGLVAEADTDTGLRTLTSAAVTELLDHGFSRVPPTGYD
ncbi:hypothetical protein [Candidatus Spongiisocius sp.]|uniref:hypothetical protein n=1 Tax=Candidatus Spongiisocius sp. TaxID=3101273 RepID=UPI003B5B0295